jgi:hypothetical protein
MCRIDPDLCWHDDGRVALAGVYQCPTACDPDCTASCHERHKPTYHRDHNPEECEQRQLGRDVTPLPPPIYSRWRTEPPPARLSRAAYGRALRAERVSWWRTALLVLRGPK